MVWHLVSRRSFLPGKNTAPGLVQGFRSKQNPQRISYRMAADYDLDEHGVFVYHPEMYPEGK